MQCFVPMLLCHKLCTYKLPNEYISFIICLNSALLLLISFKFNNGLHYNVLMIILKAYSTFMNFNSVNANTTEYKVNKLIKF